MRGSRHASERCRLEPGGWSGCEDHGFSRSGREFFPCRTSLLQFLDSYFPPAIRRGLVRQYKALTPPARQVEMRSTYRTAFERQPKSVCCQRANVEIGVEPQFDGKRCAFGNNALAGKGDGSRLLVVRSRAIHLAHDEIRRQAAWSDQDHNARCPWTGLFGGTTGRSTEPPAPRKSVVDRTPFGDQLRKDNPHFCRKSSSRAIRLRGEW